MEKNKKSGLKILVIFLYLIIIGLIGYIIFDKTMGNKPDTYCENMGKLTGVSNLKMLDKSILDEYKNYDGTYGVMESIMREYKGNKYTINLTMDGKVYISAYGEKHFINNALYIVDLVLTADLDTDSIVCYMLSVDGDVYSYRVAEVFRNNYEANLISEITNVSRLVEVHYYSEKDVARSSGIVAILENGEHLMIG